MPPSSINRTPSRSNLRQRSGYPGQSRGRGRASSSSGQVMTLATTRDACARSDVRHLLASSSNQAMTPDHDPRPARARCASSPLELLHGTRLTLHITLHYITLHYITLMRAARTRPRPTRCSSTGRDSLSSCRRRDAAIFVPLDEQLLRRVFAHCHCCCVEAITSDATNSTTTTSCCDGPIYIYIYR
jgi:hypothetical protein